MGAGAYIFGCAGPRLEREEIAFFKETDPWGFILFDRNLETAEQISALTQSLRDAVGRKAPILIDQEGGRVQRLRPPLAREWLPPLDFAEQVSDPERALWIRYRIIASELLGLGIDANCAPLADIAFPETHPFLRNRCYGSAAKAVTDRSRAVADAHLAGGVLPVLKHMPGHGRGTVDSHIGLPSTDASRETLMREEFAVFSELADLPLGMTAHMVFTAFDEAPATTSKPVIELMRRDMCFDGLLMTDDLSMEALGGTMRERTVRSLEAGCDIILHCNGKLEEMIEVAAAAGPISPHALARGDAALARRHAPEPVDIPGLEAELRGLMKDAS